MTDPGQTAFDELPADEAMNHLLTAMHAPGWARQVLAGRPYGTRAALFEAVVGIELTDDDLEQALSRHPRIGERGDDPNSRREQIGVEAEHRAELRAANQAYEARFGRVFIIRAAGLSGADVLAALHDRLNNDDETEARAVRDQLARIAQLRLGSLLDELGS